MIVISEIATIAIEITAVASIRLRFCEVRFFDCAKGSGEVEFVVGGIEGEAGGASLVGAGGGETGGFVGCTSEGYVMIGS